MGIGLQLLYLLLLVLLGPLATDSLLHYHVGCRYFGRHLSKPLGRSWLTPPPHGRPSAHRAISNEGGVEDGDVEGVVKGMGGEETKWWSMFGRSLSGRDDQDEGRVEEKEEEEDNGVSNDPPEPFLPDSVRRLFEFRPPSFARTPPVAERRLNAVRKRSLEKSEARELDKRRKAEARAEQILEREKRAREDLERRRKEREERMEREERRKEVDEFRRNLRLGRGGVKKQEPNRGLREDKKSAGTGLAPSWLPSLPFTLQGNRGKWVDLIPKTEISPGELVPVTLLGIDLLVVAPAPNVLENDGRGRGELNVYAIANACPHLGTPLETGRITLEKDCGGKTCITCPLHRSTFKLEDGGAVGEWCPYPMFYGDLFGGDKKELGVFEVREKGRWLQVRIESDVV